MNAVIVLVGLWMMLEAGVPLHVAMVWVAGVVIFLIAVAVILRRVRRSSEEGPNQPGGRSRLS